MKKHGIKKHLMILCVVTALLAAVLLCGCSQSGDEAITSLSQLNEKGRTIAVASDAPEEATVYKDFPNATILEYTNTTTAYPEVSKGRIAACMDQRTTMNLAIKNGVDGVRLLDETYCRNKIAVGISRVSSISDLKSKINTFLQKLRDDGTLDDMYNRWVVEEDETMPEIPLPENPEGTLRVATTGEAMPYTYFIGTEPAGYDIELAYRFASWLGMDVEFKVYEWTGLLSAAQGGDADCIMSNLYYTEEHEEAIDFSDILFEVEITAMVKDDGSSDASGNTEAKGGYDSLDELDGKRIGVLASLSSLFRGIAESFEKTFIRESRWKLLAQGCVTTLFITVLAVVLGTVLGFAVYLLCRGGNPIANKITRICFWLVDGMPGVVLLMIFYYVIFGGVSISGAWVSVIAFTLVFGSAVYSMLKTGVGAIDKGQTEAACALGYTDRQAFFRVVLPQAVPHILPSYTGQVTSLIKATAVVGYIAVQDLTKMGDIIRSRTYEAFFPLITVAVLYFILAGILSFAVKRIGRLLDTKQRPNGVLLKGVEIHD